ncbi:hypothetical protein CLOP_g16396 [Closterium sp. NIES-67]|nr:hypothetical protein CLOP_g19548 [Closterium sp. NIES-67]GJP82736.1 hypothetical protein CLOP_g12979 [Closterium sp. NIES-67]GJP86367.1 hypothetical protein CLOP_g16396 [Closterium sp. NIES-67]
MAKQRGGNKPVPAVGHDGSDDDAYPSPPKRLGRGSSVRGSNLSTTAAAAAVAAAAAAGVAGAGMVGGAEGACGMEGVEEGGGAGSAWEGMLQQLEREAYLAVIRAFGAQSEAITWAKERLMSDLRKELNIQDEVPHAAVARARGREHPPYM